MLGSKALRTCSVCRDKLRTSRINGVLQVAGPSSSRTLNTTPKHDYLAESKSIGTDIDDSVFASHPLTNPDSNHGHRRISATRASEEGQGLEDGGEEWIPREERRSPAAVFGSKRVGLEMVPRRMEENIQSEINNHHPREIREAFLSSLTDKSDKQKSKPGRYNDPSKATSSALARAATALPGDYAVMSNIVRELNGRLGTEWVGEGVIEISSSHGPGLWALREGGHGDKNMKLIQTSRYGLELSKKLFEGRAVDSEDGLEEGEEEPSGEMSFERKLGNQQGKASVAISSFYLSTLPTQSSRQVHLRQLLASSPETIILVDRSSREGWAAISEARSYLLSHTYSSTAPTDDLHVIAPCPHEFECPLAGGRDRCSFSQKLQRPDFTRKTKHTNKGEEDVNYTYLVLGRGKRPASSGLASSSMQVGRVGGVGKEVLEKEAEKREGKSELREVEGGGGEFEMVSLSDIGRDSGAGSIRADEQTEEEVDAELRTEAYTWPRVVAPPMKRAGHVILDTCFPDGNIQRLTYAKSHSKQVYHDARKSAWGDLFPHEPKVKVVRKRGVRKLVKEEGFAIPTDDGADSDLVMEDGLEIEGMPTAELEAGNSEEVITYKSSRGQRREYSTSARPRLPIMTPFQRRHMSARPESMPSTTPTKTKVTLNTLRSLAASNTPITCLTAYDFPTALLSETAGIDMVLVGDSLSQVALGQSSTTQITLDEMIHHAKAVTRGAKTPFVFADMPFGSFEQSLEVGVGNVIRMIKESGVDGVKIEGGREIVPLVRRLSAIGIPVIPHLGLQPQRATSLSGYLVQGKTTSAAIELFNTAKELHEAGATGFLLEAIPHKLATYISDELQTITIGIGAGSGTHAQVLVITDVLGLYEGEGARPRFVRGFGRVGEEMRKAVEGYREEVKGGGFPEMGKETYGMKKEEWEGFLKAKEAEV